MDDMKNGYPIST